MNRGFKFKIHSISKFAQHSKFCYNSFVINGEVIHFQMREGSSALFEDSCNVARTYDITN